MNVSINVEDEAWLALDGLDQLARSAVAAALSGAGVDENDREIALLFTDDLSIAAINADWRGKNKATNVLSFPSASGIAMPAGEPRPLGDIVLAHGVIVSEAAEQGRTLHNHTTHLIIHGVLHLLGFDHGTEAQAQEMEGLEIRILKGLGISDPYE
jgi:probable rRNA maturation factor